MRFSFYLSFLFAFALLLTPSSDTVALAQEDAPHCKNVGHAYTSGTIRECFILNGSQNLYTWTSYRQGARFSNGDVASKDHNAIDIGESAGRPVYAIWRGKVINTDARAKATGCGKMVTIFHPQTNLISYMCHFLDINVVVGQEVVAGQTVGLVDSTGTKTTGHHIHLQLLTANASGQSTGSPLSEAEIIKLPAFREVQIGGILTVDGFIEGSGQTLVRAGLFNPDPIGELDLEVSWPKIPGTNQTLNQLVEGNAMIDVGQIIGILFSLALWISGILAFISIVYAGFAYIISGANPGQRGTAVERVKGVAIGAAILLTSVILLNLINPSLTELRNITLPSGGDEKIRIPGIVDDDGRKNVSGSDLNCFELLTENDPFLEGFAAAVCEDGSVTVGEIENRAEEACGDAYVQEDIEMILGVAQEQCETPGGTVGSGNDQIELTETTMGELCTANVKPPRAFADGELFDPYASQGEGAYPLTIVDPRRQEGDIREALTNNLSALGKFCEGIAPGTLTLASSLCSIGEVDVIRLTTGQSAAIVNYCFDIIPKP